MLSGVYVYAHDAVDITTTGLVGDLMPTKCLFEEEKNGKSVLTLSLQYDEWGKWKAVKNGNYIKAMVPVRVPPKIVNNKYAERVATYQVKKGLSKDVTLYVSCGIADKTSIGSENFRMHYVKDSGGGKYPVKTKKYLKAGSEVQVLEEKSDGRCKVYNKDFGTGWTFIDNLELVKTSTIKQRIDGVEAVSDTVKLQYQLFQVEHVEQTLRGMNVTANHVFYELSKNFTNYENAADMEAFVTINGVMDSMVTPDARFTILTDCEDSAGAVDYRQTNVAQAFLDPENGICAKYGLSLIRDNYEAYALKDVGTDRGFVVEYARNMLGVECVEDISDTITRLVPYGADKDGNPVYLDEMYIDSEHIGDYAFPRIAYLDCSDSATESDTMTIAQVKAELRRRAEEEFANGTDKPNLSMTVQFIPLGDTEEYRQYRDLDKVFLFDRITVKDSVRMYDYSAEVVGMVYNVLTRRMESCTIGSLQKSSGVRKVAVWQVPTIDGGNIRLKSLHAGAFADGSIPTTALKDGAVTVDKIAAGALSADLITAGSITTDKLAAGAVTADKIDAGAIAAIGISAGSITTDKLAAGAVTADKIAAGTIEAIGISAGSITTDKLDAGAVTADKIAANTITADSGIIADSAIGTTQIADGSITDAKIVSLTASKITAGTIDAAEVNVVNLRADNITTGTINGQVIPELGSDKIKDGAISGVKIYNGAVTTDKIDDGAVTSAKVVANAITAEKIATNAVTANKILAGAITTDKLDANAVTADKIKANTITANKLASDVGSSLDLSSNKAITTLVKDVGGKAVTFTQYNTPAGYKTGDIWVNTGNTRWEDISGGTWADVSASKWGELYNKRHKTRVYNGKTWEVLADQGVVIDQETRINQTESKISLMATKTDLDGKVSKTEYKQDAESINMRVQTVEQNSGKAETVTNTAMTLDSTGIHMKTGGTFTIDSQKFDINEKGQMSAADAIISGDLQVGGFEVWHKGDLVVSTATPPNPTNNMVWIKPDTSSVPAAGTWRHAQLDARPFKSPVDLPLDGTSIGAAPSGSTYTYEVSIPIFHSFNSSEAYDCTVYLGATSGAQTINMGTQSISKQGSGVYKFTATSSTWLGNSATIYIRVVMSNNFYLSVDSYSSISCVLTAKSSSAGAGWKNCTVQMYVQ